eukprot:FR737039.1.p4 GENE.FR737039.1~~FR737039.1.p4  ORF type:complete len:102 (+),score=40.97 FR737039.1:833-1138(+)
MMMLADQIGEKARCMDFSKGYPPLKNSPAATVTPDPKQRGIHYFKTAPPPWELPPFVPFFGANRPPGTIPGFFPFRGGKLFFPLPKIPQKKSQNPEKKKRG